jgi:acyl carrier protein
LPDGNILFKGRVDSQVKIRGFRIELEGIEDTVKKIEGIVDSACIVSEEIVGEKQLAIYAEASGEISSEKLREIISLQLPNHVIPDFIIVMEKLPLTSTGKIDRKALIRPRKILSEITKEDHSSASFIEKKVIEIWKDLLKLEKINRESNFFNIGGNSLNSVELNCVLSEAINHEIPIDLIFEEPVLKNFSLGTPSVLRFSKAFLVGVNK